MRRLIPDGETVAEVDHSAMDFASSLGGYTPLAFHPLCPSALHLTREPEPFLWWHENHSSPGNETGDRSSQLIDPWDCFSRFCALHGASDEAVSDFAGRYGVLGIWPCRREFCVIDLSRPYRERLWWNSLGSDWQRRWLEDRSSSEHFYADADHYVWYGEPTSLWRRLAKHLRALARIGAMLHRDELPAEGDWKEVLLPEEIDVRRFARNEHYVWEPMPRIEAQRRELADLINRWLANVTTNLYLRETAGDKIGVFLSVGLFEGRRWTPNDYEECVARGYASGDLRAASGWNRDRISDLEIRPSLLLNMLILQLTAIITTGAALCPRCGSPSSSYGPSGKRLPVTKTYCGEGCKAEARKETKRNSWHKAQQNRAGANE